MQRGYSGGDGLISGGINTRSEWKDATAADNPTRHVTRIDTACAAAQFGTKEDEFAREFFIVHAFSSDNELFRMITEIQIVRDEPFPIGSTVDLLEEERIALFTALSGVLRRGMRRKTQYRAPHLYPESLWHVGWSV